MRIDDLNRSLQTQDAEKTGAVSNDRAKLSGTASRNSDSDAADISSLAANALDPAGAASPIDGKSARVEQLRLQVERGEYHVSSDDLAASIIDQHTVS